MDWDWTIYFRDFGFTRCPDELLLKKIEENWGNIAKIVHRTAE